MRREITFKVTDIFKTKWLFLSHPDFLFLKDNYHFNIFTQNMTRLNFSSLILISHKSNDKGMFVQVWNWKTLISPPHTLAEN